MPSHAEAYRNRAALARSFGDLPTADWCDEQAREHERLAASIARLDGYSQEQHQRGIEAARERANVRREARRERAHTAANRLRDG